MVPIGRKGRGAFTLIELLVVIAIIAVLSVVVILSLNPAELLRQARDAGRLADIDTLNRTIGLLQVDRQISMGNASTVYASFPDRSLAQGATSTCPGAPTSSPVSGWTYQCVSATTYRQPNGTGWLPIDFTQFSGGPPFSLLPTDPVNTSSSGDFYSYATNGNNYEVTTHPESQKYLAGGSSDGGQYADLYEKGTLTTLLPVDYGGTNAGTGIWVVDYGNNRVEKFDLNGNYLFQIGCSTGACSTGSGSGQFNTPYGITGDASGNVYVTDFNGGRVEKFGNTGGYLAQFGSPGSGNGAFAGPAGIALDASGNMFVGEMTNVRVQKLDKNGSYSAQFCTSGSGCVLPANVAVDASGNVYVVDTVLNQISKFSNTGSLLSSFGSAGTGNGQFSSPFGIAIDASGNLYVADSRRVQKLTSAGSFISKFGSAGTGPGQFGSSALLVALDASGNIYVTDPANNRVQKFDSGGNYLFQIGCSTGACSTGSGSGQFNNPMGVTIK